MPFVLLLLTSLSFAAPAKFKLDFIISLNNERISSGRVITFAGQLATISHAGKYDVQILAERKLSSENKKAILLDFIVKDSKGKILARPKVKILDGHEAQVTIENDKSELFSLVVTGTETK